MRIGFIGAGQIGGALARHLAAAGHEVAVSNSRGPETLRGLVSELGGNARAASAAEAAAFGDLVVVSVPLGRYRELPRQGFDGKVVIETNNYFPRRDGRIEALDEKRATVSELLEARLEGARLVRAFNAIPATRLRRAARADDPRPVRIGVAGDDADAKRMASELIEQMGFQPYDAGPLPRAARRPRARRPRDAQ